jgi:hypothetical protein
MLTTTIGISAEEEADRSFPVVVAIDNFTAANLTDLVGDEYKAMSLDLERWRSSK